MMQTAKSRLEDVGYTVVGGFVSPSHDSYVRGKCRRKGIPFEPATSRCALADAAVNDVPWLSVGKWESDADLHSSWPDFPVVTEALQASLLACPSQQELASAKRVIVLYVCGADHACMTGSNTVVIGRKGDPLPRPRVHLNVFAFEAASADVAAISSTRFRKVLAAGQNEDAAQIVGDTVYREITARGMYGVGVKPA